MKLYVIDLGKIVMEANNVVTKEDCSEGEKPAIPIHAFLIDGPAGKVLFDAGCHPKAMDGAWPEDMCTNPYICEMGIVQRLAAIDVRPEDITHLVLSHLHLDHAGCVHLFPNAQVYVQEDELRETMAAYENHDLDMFHLICDVENWIQSDVKWKTVKGAVVELCPGVRILDLGSGHSFGMLALHVDLNCGSYLLVSDAAYSAVHYGPPAELSGVVYDVEGYFAAIETIRTYAADHDAVVLFGHDMKQFQSLIKSDDGYYE